jgi:hypothetical protein
MPAVYDVVNQLAGAAVPTSALETLGAARPAGLGDESQDRKP